MLVFKYNQNEKNKESCLYYSNRRILSGCNDLAITNSDLVKDGNLKPADITAGSNIQF